jgi:hypothetical protein
MSDGTPIVAVRDSNPITFTASATGTVYVRVERYSGSDTGSYTIVFN